MRPQPDTVKAPAKAACAGTEKFTFAGMTVRVVTIGGAPWFVTADVCRALDLAIQRSTGKPNVTMASKGLAADERGISNVYTPSSPARPTSVSVISESGLYKLVMLSRVAAAKSFQEWVTRVVLPAIRKDGGYVMGEEKVAAGELCAEKGGYISGIYPARASLRAAGFLTMPQVFTSGGKHIGDYSSFRRAASAGAEGFLAGLG